MKFGRMVDLGGSSPFWWPLTQGKGHFWGICCPLKTISVAGNQPMLLSHVYEAGKNDNAAREACCGWRQPSGAGWVRGCWAHIWLLASNWHQHCGVCGSPNNCCTCFIISVVIFVNKNRTKMLYQIINGKGKCVKLFYFIFALCCRNVCCSINDGYLTDTWCGRDATDSNPNPSN